MPSRLSTTFSPDTHVIRRVPRPKITRSSILSKMSKNTVPKKKVAKKQPPKAPLCYTSHLIHTRKDRDWSKEKIFRIVIIDPGYVNLGFRIERREVDTRKVITEVMIRKTLTKVARPASSFAGDLIGFLNDYRELFMNTHIVLIEKQVVMNYDMVVAGPIIMTYFATILRDAPLLPLLIEVFATVKTNVLGDRDFIKSFGYETKSQKRSAVKKWSKFVAPQILKARGDEKGLAILKNEKKKDDISDTIIMPDAFLILLEFDFNIPFLDDLLEIEGLKAALSKTIERLKTRGVVKTLEEPKRVVAKKTGVTKRVTAKRVGAAKE